MPRLLEPLMRGQADYVVGSRFLHGVPQGMRLERRVGNAGFSLLISMLSGHWINDGQSGFRAFFGERAAFYADQVRRYQELVSIDRMWLWLETRFPERYDRYTIVFSPLINGSHSTQRFTTGGTRETVMFIAGPDAAQNTADARLRTAQLERLVFTEIDHNYVNPATDRHSKRVREIFRDVTFWNGDRNYRSATATFNEYMTWAVFNLYARDTYDPVTAAAFRESVIQAMVRQRRFHKFREFEQIVMDVSAASGPRPCIPNLYGDVLDRAAAIR